MTEAYLDYNATAPMRPETLAVVTEAMQAGGNPSSRHRVGQVARRRLDKARAQVAHFFGVASEAVIFTSGATESNHAALASTDGPVLLSAIEHPSVASFETTMPRIPATADGTVCLASLEDLLQRHAPAMVAVMAANNETGIIQPIEAIARLVHAAGATLHVDAVQAAAKRPVPLGGIDGADSIAISGHKLGGPVGAGALILSSDRPFRPWLQGGGQEGRRRAGTENVPAILGLAHALCSPVDWQEVAELRQRLEDGVHRLCPEARILGEDGPRLPNTTCLLTPGIDHEAQLIAMDMAGIRIGSGSACSSGKVGPSPVLSAMGIEPAWARTAIRVSLGWDSRIEHVEAFLAAYAGLVKRGRHRAVLSSRA